jgi:hypothetical protein
MTKFQPLTLVHVVVEPNRPGGCDGPPIEVGVGRIMRTREHAKSIEVTFDPPRADLLGVDFDPWTDEQIEALRPSAAPWD